MFAALQRITSEDSGMQPRGSEKTLNNLRNYLLTGSVAIYSRAFYPLIHHSSQDWFRLYQNVPIYPLLEHHIPSHLFQEKLNRFSIRIPGYFFFIITNE